MEERGINFYVTLKEKITKFLLGGQCYVSSCWESFLDFI